ncbi:MAG: TRAP transporter large permease [Tagaea sp.]|nr:TRAP transporter large permease [Tagaea sp.]
MSWLLVAGLILFLTLNVPVAYAMLGVSIVYLLIKQDLPLVLVAQQVAAGTDKFLLLAIPFFFLAAEFMNSGGIMRRLVDLARALVGHLRGGLGLMNVLASMFFAGVSGSAVADAAGMGRMEIEMMRRGGYPHAFSAAITAASATIGPIIPPSIPLVVYGSIANVSVGKLFLGGVVPGVFMGLFLMASVWVIAGRRGFPRSAWIGWREFFRAIAMSAPVIVLPVIILGGIFSGVFTATESAIVAAAYALVVGLSLRELRPADVPGLLVRVAADTSRVMLIVASAALFSWILAREGLPVAVTQAFLAIDAGPWLFLFLVNLLLLVLGCFMEPLPIMVIVVPTLLPVVKALGIDLVHFGLVVTLNLMIGLITPPVGLLLFLIMDMTKLSLEALMKETWPFLAALIAVLGLITYFPVVVLAVPNYFFG